MLTTLRLALKCFPWAMLQVQAIVVGFLASVAAMIFGWIPKGTFDIHHGFILCASSVVTASLASLILGECDEVTYVMTLDPCVMSDVCIIKCNRLIDLTTVVNIGDAWLIIKTCTLYYIIHNECNIMPDAYFMKKNCMFPALKTYIFNCRLNNFYRKLLLTGIIKTRECTRCT